MLTCLQCLADVSSIHETGEDAYDTSRLFVSKAEKSYVSHLLRQLGC